MGGGQARTSGEFLKLIEPGRLDNESMGNEQSSDKLDRDLILCYLVCPTDAAGGFTGAVLLTDNRARPQHFAFVQPVKPTKLQRLLYGSTLDEYVRVDVIAQKLWQGLPKKPDVLFVEVPELIAARVVTGVPTACLSKVADSQANPSSLSTLRYDVGLHPEDESVVGEIVAALEGTCNLFEPFTRIKQALTEGLKPGT
jgi:hypothetical protein